MKDLRCTHKLHGRLLENGLVEVACQSRFCGKQPNNVVLHQFDLETGKLVKTEKYKVPHTKGDG